MRNFSKGLSLKTDMLALVMIGASVACTGEAGQAENQGAPDEVDEDGNPIGGSGVPDAPTLQEFTPAPARLALLTAAQYRSSLADLLAIDGAGIDVPGDVPLYGFSTVGASSLSASATTVDLLDRSVRTQVEKVFADATRRQSLTGCSTNATGIECVDSFIRGFGRRAFRRPLEDAEINRLRSLYDTVVAKSDRWRGLQMVTMAMLVSPKFLYQAELGVADAEDSVPRALTGFELASRLSFWLTGSTPDDELLDAAEQGELVDGPGIRKQALRLLDGPRASDALIRFFGELYSLPVDRIEKDADKFPFVANHPEIGKSMRNETSALVSHIVLERDGNVAEVLNSDITFVDPLLAEFYDATALRDAEGKVHWPDDAPPRWIADPCGDLVGSIERIGNRSDQARSLRSREDPVPGNTGSTRRCCDAIAGRGEGPSCDAETTFGRTQHQERVQGLS
jgi:Protein of unknown function (DUF1592)/Protein of unknown function (DUF1595)